MRVCGSQGEVEVQLAWCRSAWAEALRYWEDAEFGMWLGRTSALLETGLMQEAFGDLQIQICGRGLVFGLESARPDLNAKAAEECFRRGRVIETCGSTRNVLKFLPPLTIPHDVLAEGLAILEQSLAAVAGKAAVST